MKLTNSNAAVFTTFGRTDPRFYIPIQINNDKFEALIDCGLAKTYVGQQAANVLGNFGKSDLFMRAANNN